MIKRIIGAVVVIVLAIASLTGCTRATKSQVEGQKQTEQAFSQQSKAVPYPAEQLRNSLERENIRRKLLAENKPSQIGYVYLLSFGKFIGYYTIKGKVSSTQSQMTTEQLQVKACDSCDRAVMTGPGDDGSYGDNEPGIFFFTTSGALVKTSSDYIYSNEPLTVGDVPELNK